MEMEMKRKSPGPSSSPSTRPHKISSGVQILLRLFVVVSSAFSAYLMLTSKEDAIVYGLSMSASYSYSLAFKFSGYMNIASSGFGLISLIIVWTAIRQGNPTTTYFSIFLHDLVMTALLIGGCAAATAIGYVGKHGLEEAGWVPICDHFGRFCNRVTISVLLGFASAIFFLLLSIISALNSRHIHISSENA